MEETNATAASEYSSAASSDELAAKVVQKRFEGLVLVRTKAIKGKGAWYWAHLEPVLVHNPDTGLPKSVKLRCSLCDAVFSASNPSRTASEHLKRGTCPSFASAPKPISSVPSPSSISATQTTTASHSSHNHRKRSSGSRSAASAAGGGGSNSVGAVPPLAIIDPSRFTVDLSYPPAVSIASTSSAAAAATGGGGGVLYGHHHYQNQQQQQKQQLVLSGGKEDLGALAMLEDSVKRLKSPKSAPPAPTLNKAQIDAALDYLADWVYECYGSSISSLSSIDHPKFKAFLNQIGVPPISRKELAGARLDTKYEEAKADSEAKIREAMFFQIAADGWKNSNSHAGDGNLVHLAVNLPNGTNIYRRAVFTAGYVPSKYAEEILWDTITDICGNNSVQQCVGIVSDGFNSKALRNLENQHHWMVNICCQYKGVNALIKDFAKELPLFKNVTENCFKLANFINNNSKIRHSFNKYQIQENGHATLLRLQPVIVYKRSDFSPIYSMIDDILNSARALQLVLLDDSYKMVLMEEPTIAREIEEMMRNPNFWNELEAVHSLVKLIKTMADEIESEKPRVAQCLPLWEELRAKLKDWCSKFQIAFEGNVDKVFDKRLKRNYHPSWSAAFILDPFYLIRDNTGKYLPPFKCLTHEQEKDVDKIITRLVSRDEAHIALMELMRWRTEGLDPVYARAVQLKQRDSVTGKMRIANPQSSRLVWETYLNEFKTLGKVAVRLICLQATSCGFKPSLGLLKRAGIKPRSRVGIERAQKMIFIAAHSKMENKREFFSSGEDDDDVEVFAVENGEDDVLNDVFVDTPSPSI